MRKSRSAFWAWAAAVALASGAQEPAPTPSVPELLLPTVETEVVNVDVFATGKDGRPVKDLKADDFEVYEDGKRVPVVNFLAGLQAPPGPGEPAVSVPDAPPVAARERGLAERLHVVVYVDNANLDVMTRRRVLEPLERFFTGERPGQRVMVVTSLQGFRVRLPFTDDLAAVRATLKQVAKDHAEQALQAQKRILIRQLETADDDEAARLLSQVRNYAQQSSKDLENSLLSLRGTLDLMGGLPGRKLMLYVADGYAMQPGLELFQMFANRFGEAAVDDTGLGGSGGGRGVGLFSLADDLRQSHAFKDVLSHANANRVTLHAIDAAQASPRFSVNAEDAAFDSFGERRAHDATAITQETYERSGTLAYLAEYTGGRRLAGNLKLKERLAELGEEVEAGYALAYTPPRGADGRYHKIDVKTTRAGVALRHREGYRSKTTEERSSDLALSSLLGETDNPLGLVLKPGQAKPQEKGLYTLPLVVMLPVGRLQLDRQGDADVGKLVLYFVVQDQQGGLSEPQRRDVPLRFKPGEIKPGSPQTMGYPVPLKIKAGEYVVGVGVRDELAGRRSGASVKVKVG